MDQAERTEALRSVEPVFRPECLTVYLNNRCNCRCVYCYAASARLAAELASANAQQVSMDAVAAAGRLVAAVCRDKGLPFTLVLHGGGEPTLDDTRMRSAVRVTRALADAVGCGWRGHLATNGIMAASKAEWIATHFDTIGLSHDGPPDLHNRQRPLADGQPSLPITERTLKRLLAGPAHVYARTTVLPDAVDRQEEIVAYLIGHLGLREVRIEPAYRVVDGAPQVLHDASVQARRFVDAFMAARARAISLGGALTYSGARPDEPHGPYCNVLRDTLHLLPDNTVTACFLCTGADDPNGPRKACIGQWSATDGRLVLDETRILALRRLASRIPDRCRQCLAVNHCTHGCPDVCPASGDAVPDAPTYRCEISRGIFAQLMLEAAAGQPTGALADS